MRICSAAAVIACMHTSIHMHSGDAIKMQAIEQINIELLKASVQQYCRDEENTKNILLKKKRRRENIQTHHKWNMHDARTTKSR